VARVKKRWNQQDRPRTIAQMANAIAATVWKLAAGVVLNLENDNFETGSQAQRLETMEEVVCYLIHICDRSIHDRASAAERLEFITALARDLARMLEDSRVDVEGKGEYQQTFLNKFNHRSTAYSGYGFDPREGASFSMRCRLGNEVGMVMGERDRRWIPDYIVGREAPEIESALRRSMMGLTRFEAEVSKSAGRG